MSQGPPPDNLVDPSPVNQSEQSPPQSAQRPTAFTVSNSPMAEPKLSPTEPTITVTMLTSSTLVKPNIPSTSNPTTKLPPTHLLHLISLLLQTTESQLTPLPCTLPRPTRLQFTPQLRSTKLPWSSQNINSKKLFKHRNCLCLN